MPRKDQLREELESGGVLTNEFGQEAGRLTLNGILVLNLAEVFFEIERQSSRHGWCPISRLNIVFGRWGTWKADTGVTGAVYELADLGVIEIGEKRVRPIMLATKALKRIPRYITAEELIAGLEPLND